MTKHTEGPWNVDPDIMKSKTWRDTIMSEDGKVVAATFRHYDQDPTKATPEEDRDKANARLIAAAPELLAALKQIHAHALNAYQSDGEVFVDETYLLNACENAIAKAEGEGE